MTATLFFFDPVLIPYSSSSRSNMRISGIKTANWLSPRKETLHEPFGGFENLRTIDWRQSSRMSVGDVVYIYCIKPYRRVMFMGEILLTDIVSEEADRSDLQFHKQGMITIPDMVIFG